MPHHPCHVRCAALALALPLIVPLAAGAGQETWARFRGPAAGVVADDPALPDRWSETENVIWSVDIPGLSWSSPVVWEDHIFVTSAISAGEEPPPRALRCGSETSKTMW